MENVDRAFALILSAAAVIAVVYSGHKWARPRVHHRWVRFQVAVDSIVGRPAMVDPITQKVLAPALPGIGERMASIETLVEHLVLSDKRHESHDQHLAIHDQKLAAIGERMRLLEDICPVRAQRLADEENAR